MPRATGTGTAKEKNRHAESEDMDKTLRDAGFSDEEDLLHLEKKQMLQALNESLLMHQEAEAASQTHHRTLSLTGRGPNARLKRRIKQGECGIANEEVKKEAMEMEEGSPREETVSPEILENSQDGPVFIASPFLDEAAVAASESDADDEAANQDQTRASAASEIFHSDCKEEEVTRAIASKTDHNTSPAFLLEEEESSQSFKSSCDDVMVTRHTPLAVESHVPFDSRPNSLIQRDTRRLLAINVLDCAMGNEPIPFYEQLLSLRQKGNYTRLPLYYDPLLNMSKEEHMRRVSQELEKNAVLMSEMQSRRKNQQENKSWALPIKACGDKKIETLDKKVNSEPEKCSQLPWGEQPLVLDYTYKPGKPVTPSFSYREGMKLPGRPKVFVRLNSPGPSGIQSTAAEASSSSFNTRSAKMIGMVPLPQVKKYGNNENATQVNKKSESERQQQESTKKSSIFSADLDDDDDIDWTPNKQKGRRGKGKGNKSAKGGVVHQGGGQGRGGRGRGVEHVPPLPPIVGMHFPNVCVTKQTETAQNILPSVDVDMDVLTTNTTLESTQNGTICPICGRTYPQATIVSHAAFCGLEEKPPPECCNVCNTIIPVGMMEKHKVKCEQKQRNLRSGHIGAAAILPSTSYMPLSRVSQVVDNADIMSEDEEETAPGPPAKRRRSDEF